MSAEEYLPARRDSIAALRSAAEHCEGCDLYKKATQTVFGQGKSRNPDIMLVGEQPGDVEDRTGVPFVGPAGSLLDQGLEAVGLDRDLAYVTNVVKHFKWERQGKRRLHKNPSAREVAACRPWLMAEIEVTRPKVVVCLGAIAARALLGDSFRVTKQRGEMFPGPHDCLVSATLHPASILRIRDREDRRVAFDRFVDDLRLAVGYAGR